MMNGDLPRVLVIASDSIGERMAGSGIRYWNFAQVLGRQQPVTLATPNDAGLTAPEGVTLTPCLGTDAERSVRLAELMRSHDVVVAQHIPFLYADAETLAGCKIVVDLYAPWILEKLEYSRIDPDRGEADRADDVTILSRLLTLGDFFICASERQRDFWLGALAAAGRLDLAHAQADPELRTLIDVVPFGLPEKLPTKTGPGPREIYASIGANDPVALWSGGIWNWLDPLTAIRATARVIEQFPAFRLVFMGTKSPGAQVAEMEMVGMARDLAIELGLLDKHVFFNDWVEYAQRQNWLLESDLTLTLHTMTAEARFAYRTRLLDAIWCGVPTVATDGDVLADLVTQFDIGETAAAGDAAGVANAMLRALDRDRARGMRANIAEVRRQMGWDQVTEALRAYCLHPNQVDVPAHQDEAAAYLHRLEVLYSETAEYARHLESELRRRDGGGRLRAVSRPLRRVLTRPELKSLGKRDRG